MIAGVFDRSAEADDHVGARASYALLAPVTGAGVTLRQHVTSTVATAV